MVETTEPVLLRAVYLKKNVYGQQNQIRKTSRVRRVSWLMVHFVYVVQQASVGLVPILVSQTRSFKLNINRARVCV